MRIVIAGASGMIGTALSAHLAAQGHDVVSLVRRPAAGPGEERWDPAAGILSEAVLDGADAVVNLSGAGIGDRPWTTRRVAELRASRLGATTTLTAAMARLGNPPPVFLSQSASGYYGTSGGRTLREDMPPGDGVLAELCRDWETAARSAPAGVRVVTPRTGVVLSPRGGALGPLLPLLRLGLGGPLGNGRQHWPWITLEDEVRALGFVLMNPLDGAVNVCAPELADVNTIVKRLGQAFHRPALFRVPSPVLRLVLGRLAEELVLADQPMEPSRLKDAGFQWRHPSLDAACSWLSAAAN